MFLCLCRASASFRGDLSGFVFSSATFRDVKAKGFADVFLDTDLFVRGAQHYQMRQHLRAQRKKFDLHYNRGEAASKTTSVMLLPHIVSILNLMSSGLSTSS